MKEKEDAFEKVCDIVADIVVYPIDKSMDYNKAIRIIVMLCCFVYIPTVLILSAPFCFIALFIALVQIC